jgi:hypothetical protein
MKFLKRKISDRIQLRPMRNGGDRSSQLHQVIAEAEGQGDLWPPIMAGLFKGSLNRFKEIASGYSQKIAQLGWR